MTEELPEVFVYCSKLANFQCKGVVVLTKLLSDKQRADVKTLQTLANRNGVIKQELVEIEEGWFQRTGKFKEISPILAEWDNIIDEGSVSINHGNSMFVCEQELKEPIEGPIDFFELLKASITSAGVVQIANAVLHIDGMK
jgi:hypothetical protein